MKAYFFLTALLFALSFSGNAQGTGINHYQRKVKSASLQCPGELFSSKDYLIVVPDSIYSFGKVIVKKINFSAFTANSFQLRFENNVIQNVQFTVKGKASLEKFSELMKGRFGTGFAMSDCVYSITLENGQRVKCVISQRGRKRIISMKYE